MEHIFFFLKSKKRFQIFMIIAAIFAVVAVIAAVVVGRYEDSQEQAGFANESGGKNFRIRKHLPVSELPANLSQVMVYYTGMTVVDVSAASGSDKKINSATVDATSQDSFDKLVTYYKTAPEGISGVTASDTTVTYTRNGYKVRISQTGKSSNPIKLYFSIERDSKP